MMEPEKPTSVPPKDSEPIPATPVSEPKEDMRGDVLQVSDFTPEEERRIRRKIDYYVLPILCMVFLVQYLDKQSLSYAAVFDLRSDLSLSPSQYSWTSSMFFFGQLVSEYIFIYLMSRLPLIKLVGLSIVIWGGVCMCLAAPNNFAGFTTVRFFLGFTEGAAYPAFVTITSLWYQKDQHATRVGIWVSMNGLAQVVGPLLMYGIAKNTSLSTAPWRVMFLVCGAVSIAIGGVFFAFVPTDPRDSWFFTQREKDFLAQRMLEDREGGDRRNFDTKQLKEALLDVKAWLMCLCGFILTMVSPVLIFASIVINDIGYDRFETMLYTAPSGAVQILFIWIGVAGCAVFPKYRLAVCAALVVAPLIGNSLLLKLDISDGWGLIAASWLASCVSCIMSIVLSISASNVKGNTKRATVNTFFFIGYCVGAIAGPQIWVKPPRYLEGVTTAIALWVVFVIVIGIYFYLCYRDNKARDQKIRAGENQMLEGDEDLTDKQDLLFRYSY